VPLLPLHADHHCRSRPRARSPGESAPTGCSAAVNRVLTRPPSTSSARRWQSFLLLLLGERNPAIYGLHRSTLPLLHDHGLLTMMEAGYKIKPSPGEGAEEASYCRLLPATNARGIHRRTHPACRQRRTASASRCSGLNRSATLAPPHWPVPGYRERLRPHAGDLSGPSIFAGGRLRVLSAGWRAGPTGWSRRCCLRDRKGVPGLDSGSSSLSRTCCWGPQDLRT